MVRILRFADVEASSYFDAATTEVAKTKWPKSTLQRVSTLVHAAIAGAIKTYTNLIRENRTLIPDHFDCVFEGDYGKYCVDGAYKNGFRLLDKMGGWVKLRGTEDIL